MLSTDFFKNIRYFEKYFEYNYLQQTISVIKIKNRFSSY